MKNIAPLLKLQEEFRMLRINSNFYEIATKFIIDIIVLILPCRKVCVFRVLHFQRYVKELLQHTIKRMNSLLNKHEFP